MFSTMLVIGETVVTTFNRVSWSPEYRDVLDPSPPQALTANAMMSNAQVIGLQKIRVI
jgi:hypothetical protein